MAGLPGAIIVAGGRGARLGRRRKAELDIGGRRLVDIVLDAVAGCEPRIVVGDVEVPAGVWVTREQPPYSGPAAAVGAAMTMLADSGVQPEWLLCLAVDLPGAPRLVPELLVASDRVGDGVDAIAARGDDPTRTEWLASIVRRTALESAIDARGERGLVDVSMKRLIGSLRWGSVDVPAGSTNDIDTVEDLARWHHESKPI